MAYAHNTAASLGIAVDELRLPTADSSRARRLVDRARRDDQMRKIVAFLFVSVDGVLGEPAD